MQVISPPHLPAPAPSVVALGNFDGIHLGHVRLLQHAVKTARREGLPAYVLTFTPHPQAVLNGVPVPLLLDREEKEAKLAALGIDFLVYWPFTVSLMQMAPEEFVREVLWRHFHPRVVCVGFNFTFGHGGRGTAAELARLGERFGFRTLIEAAVMVDGMVVSSSAIRAALTRGDIGTARKLLGYWPYRRGRVVPGNRRGRSLGYATANLLPPPEVLCPAPGVYAARTRVEERWWPSVLNLGSRPTFGEDLPPTLEVHLLDYHGGELYGREILVEFRRRLRPERKFASPEELRAQIQRDAEEARRLLAPEAKQIDA